MKNSIKNTLALVILNSMACGIALAQDNTQDYISVDSEEVIINFMAGSAGRAESQTVTIFEAEEKDFKYCQGEPKDDEILAVLRLEKAGDENFFGSIADIPFCIKVSDSDNDRDDDEVISYYGPFIASQGCANTFGKESNFITKTLSHIYPKSDSCHLIQHKNGNKYVPVEFNVNMDFLDKNRIWSEEYDIEIREKGTSTDCSKGSGRGDVIHKNAILLNSYVPHENSNWAEAYDHKASILENQQFCVSILQGAEDDHSQYVYHTAGPFIAKNDNGVCKIEFREQTQYDNILTSDACSLDNLNITFENVQSSGTQPTTVEIFDAGNSEDCDKGTRGDKLETFEVFPQTSFTFPLEKVTDKNSKVCLTIDSPYADLKRFGPYEANSECKFDLTYDNEVIESDACKLNS